jgi:hypothetical protein
MNIEIPLDIGLRNISEYEKKSNENSSVYSKAEKANLLGKKTKRITTDLLEFQKSICDICLEFEKYSESKLIECKKCRGVCHKRCEENDTHLLNKSCSKNILKEKYTEENWECNRCMNSPTAAHKISLK